MPSLCFILLGLFVSIVALLPLHIFEPSLEPEPDSAGAVLPKIFPMSGFTIFLPYYKPLGTLHSGSVAGLPEHVVPGLFPLPSLTKLGAFPTKLKTAAPGRCLTVTATASKIFVNSVEIIQPEIINDGRLILHGLSDFLAPLETASCDPDPMQLEALELLGDYGLLDPEMGFEIPELPSGLHNMTVFAVEDDESGAFPAFTATEVLFHVVPNRLLSRDDLERLPVGTTLPTLVRGHSLVVTQAGVAGFPVDPRLLINGVAITAANVVYDNRIAVHGVPSKFPHLVSEEAPGRAPSGESSSGGVAASPTLSPAVDRQDEDL